MIKNKARFIKGLETKMAQRPEQNIRRAMAKSGMLVRNEAIDSILRGAKTGEMVTRYNPTRQHPASDTGRLVNSIAHDVIKQGNNFMGRVIASAEYAVHLEFGTNKMGARPFLRPALHESKKKIRNIFMREGIIN